MFGKKGVRKYFTKFRTNNLYQSLFSNKVEETVAQVFSCEFYEISRNTFFYRTLVVAAFPNGGYLDSAILKDLHALQEKRDLKSRYMKFFLQIVPNKIFKVFKCLKTTWNSPEHPAELVRSLILLAIIMVKSRIIIKSL